MLLKIHCLPACSTIGQLSDGQKIALNYDGWIKSHESLRS